MQHDNNQYFNFPLKPQQSEAFIALKKFTSGNTNRIFILRGHAGTGKTSLMGGFIKWLDEDGKTYSLLASTGRAAKILSDKTKSEATTIHSHIYIFRDLDDDLETLSSTQQNLAIDDKGQISLIFDLKTINAESDKIYLIDEASMIADKPDIVSSFANFGSGELLNDLLRYDTKGKFIFVGDPCQLPPIRQEFSPALSKSYIEQKYKISTKQIELTEIIRQSSGNGIISASMLLRNLQSTNPPVKFASFPLKGHSEIVLHSSHASIVNSYIQRIKEFGFEYSTLICQTNRHCSDLNKIVRSSLGKNVLTPQIAGHNLKNKLGLIKFGNYDNNKKKIYT